MPLMHSLNHGDKEIIIFYTYLCMTLFARKISESYLNNSRLYSLFLSDGHTLKHFCKSLTPQLPAEKLKGGILAEQLRTVLWIWRKFCFTSSCYPPTLCY